MANTFAKFSFDHLLKILIIQVTKNLQEKRIQVKPGLIPPYYADLPNNFDEILKSEQKYINQKLKYPIKTDVKYFYGAFKNIVFKGARSK